MASCEAATLLPMKVLPTLLLWALLLALCWPLALLVLIAWPFLWLLTIPFRIVGAAMEALLALPGRVWSGLRAIRSGRRHAPQ